MHPVHLAFALLSDDAGDQQMSVGIPVRANKSSLFSSVIQRVGGDPVNIYYIKRSIIVLTSRLLDCRTPSAAQTCYPSTIAISAPG